MRTKTIRLFCLIAIALSCVTTIQAQTNTFTLGNFTLHYDSKEEDPINHIVYCNVTVGQLNTDTNYGDLIIPDKFTETWEDYFQDEETGEYYDATVEYTVVEVGKYVSAYNRICFANNQTITSVTLPNTLTSIGDYAFRNCQNLTSVTLPNTLTYIGYDAFWQCQNLTSVNLPPSLTLIDGRAFWNCNNLTGRIDLSELLSLEIRQGVQFAYTNIEEIKLPKVESVSAICQYCPKLRVVKIPNSFNAIYAGEFNGNTSLRHISIPSRVTQLAIEGILGGKNSDGKVEMTIPYSVTGFGRKHLIQAFFSYKKYAYGRLTFQGDYVNTVFYMGTKELFEKKITPDSDITMLDQFVRSNATKVTANNDPFTASDPLTMYVKPSQYKEMKQAIETKLQEYIDAGPKNDYTPEAGSIKVEYKIPVTFKAGARYTTLCRDFDIDLTAKDVDDATKKVSEGLKAFIPTSYNKGKNSIQLVEVDYVPSRTKANSGVTDWDGDDPYKGMDEYHGVILMRTDDDISEEATYYYTMGEDDYSKGKEGQMGVSTTENSKYMQSGTALNELLANSLLVGLNDEAYIVPSEIVDGKEYKYYGLAGGKVKEITSEGWCEGYNKAIFRIVTGAAPDVSSAPIATFDGFEIIDNPYDTGITEISSVSIDAPTTSNNDRWYTIDGRLLDSRPTGKGIYIHNGKKILF